MNFSLKNITTLAILYIGYFLTYTDKSLIGFLIIPIGTEFNLTAQQVGMIISIFFLGYSITYPIAGYLNDKFNSKHILIISCFCIGLSAIFLSIASAFMMIIAIRLIAGVFHGGYPSSCAKIIGTVFDTNQRTFATSILLSTSGLASIITPLLAAFLIQSFGWRITINILGVAFILTGIFIAIFLKLSPNSKTPLANNENISPITENKPIKLTSVILNKNVLIIFLSLFFINIIAYGMIWVPKYLSEAKNIDLNIVGKILSFSGISSVLTAIFGGYFIGKFMENKERMLVLYSGIIGAILAYYMIYVENIILLSICFFVLTLLVQIIFLTVFTLPLKKSPKIVLGTFIGFVSTGGTLGGFSSAIIIGKILAITNSYNGMFIAFSLAFLFTGISMFFFTKNKGLIVLK